MSRRVSIFGASFASVSYLLDDATIASGIAAPFALFRLKTGYTGAVVDVRRTVGVTTTIVTIGLGTANYVSLDSPVISVVTGSSAAVNLGEFVAASGYPNPDGIAANQDGRISAGYEQIGGTQVCVQTTATRQPFIVTAGVLETLNGVVCRRYAGPGQKLDFGLLGGASKPANYSVIQIASVNAISGIQCIGGSSNAFDRTDWGYSLIFQPVRGLRMSTQYGDEVTFTRVVTNANYWAANQQQLHEQYKSGGVLGVQLHLNGGGALATTITGTITTAAGTNYMYAEGNAGARTDIGFTGKHHLTLVWLSNKSSVRAAIKTKLNEMLGTTW